MRSLVETKGMLESILYYGLSLCSSFISEITQVSHIKKATQKLERWKNQNFSKNKKMLWAVCTKSIWKERKNNNQKEQKTEVKKIFKEF